MGRFDRVSRVVRSNLNAAVSSAEEVAARLEVLKKEDRKNALLMMSSKEGDIRFVVVRIDE